MDLFTRSFLMLFVLLNPFILGLYLLEVVTALVFKRVHDHIRVNREPLLHRYTEIVGRAAALFTGSFAIDMLLRGVEDWLAFVASQP